MKSELGQIAEVQTGPFGSQLHKEDYVTNGTPIVTVEHLGKRAFTTQNLPRVSEKDRMRLQKYILNQGDIVFSRVGAIDRCSYVGESENGWMFSGRCLRVRPNKSIINSKYLYYYLTTNKLKDYIRSVAVGATMPSINTTLLSKVIIKYPTINEQNAIASTLSCLDDKIELNNKINSNLEAQAQAIFKSWFVDFEPFRDGEFVDSELGMIPNGWRVGTLEEVGIVVGGSTPSKENIEYYTESGKGIAWITPKDLSIKKTKFISHGVIDITDKGYKSSSTKLMPSGSVLFSSRAPIGYMAIADGEVCTNQGFKSVVPNENIGTAYIYFTLQFRLEEIQNLGSGSTFKEISGSVMKSLKIIIPDLKYVEELQRICNTIFEQQMIFEKQNHILAAIRDALLPKLMSGEINVPIE